MIVICENSVEYMEAIHLHRSTKTVVFPVYEALFTDANHKHKWYQISMELIQEVGRLQKQCEDGTCGTQG